MAFSAKLFLEKEKQAAVALIEDTYRKFWKVNSNIFGYEELKNIQNFDEKREFLMGVASEIPLADVSAHVLGNEQKAAEFARNNERLRKNFTRKAT